MHGRSLAWLELAQLPLLANFHYWPTSATGQVQLLAGAGLGLGQAELVFWREGCPRPGTEADPEVGEATR